MQVPTWCRQRGYTAESEVGDEFGGLDFMTRNNLRIGHAAAGMVALVLIVRFQTATIASELFGDAATIAAVKAAILRAMALLVAALAATGISGMALAGGKPRGRAARKLVRMKYAAALGIVILVPAAFFLAACAEDGTFDAAFYAVQAIEIAAGIANLTLIGLNLRDGLRMASGRRQRDAATAAFPPG